MKPFDIGEGETLRMKLGLNRREFAILMDVHYTQWYVMADPNVKGRRSSALSFIEVVVRCPSALLYQFEKTKDKLPVAVRDRLGPLLRRGVDQSAAVPESVPSSRPTQPVIVALGEPKVQLTQLPEWSAVHAPIAAITPEWELGFWEVQKNFAEDVLSLIYQYAASEERSWQAYMRPRMGALRAQMLDIPSINLNVRIENENYHLGRYHAAQELAGIITAPSVPLTKDVLKRLERKKHTAAPLKG